MYKCDIGYHLQGEGLFGWNDIESVTCLSTGQHSDHPPCVPITGTVATFYDDHKDEDGWKWLLGLGITISLCCVCCCTRRRKKKRRKRLERGQPLSQDEQYRVPVKGDGSGTGQGHRSLRRNKNLPRWVRTYVPAMLLINVGFFVMGHIWTAAQVDIVMKLFGREIRLDRVVEFSLANSLADMIKAKVWPLVILVGGLSGVWPYAKLSMIFACWLVPPSRMRPKQRGKWLMTLDCLGKLSLIDLFIMVLIMLAFRVSVTSPDAAVLPPQLWQGDLKVTSVWGLFAFTIAAVSSLIVNNVAIHYHRNALAAEYQANWHKRQRRQQREADAADEPSGAGAAGRARSGYEALRVDETPPAMPSPHSESDDTDDADLSLESSQPPAPARRRLTTSWYDAGTLDVQGPRSSVIYSREALRNHIFSLQQYEVWFRRPGQILVAAFLAASIVCTMLGGFFVPSFSIEVNGLAAVAIKSGGGSTVTDHTIWSSFQHIMLQADEDETESTRLGIYVLGVTYVAFALIVPLLQQVGLLLLWLLPLTLAWQKRFFFLNEVLHAWASLPIFLMALVVLIVEIGMLSGNLVPKEIAPESLLQAGNDWGLLSDEDLHAKMFQVHARPLDGLWILLIAFICEYLGATIVVRCAEVALDEREERVTGRPRDEEQEMGCGKPIMNKLLQGTTCCGIPLSPGLKSMPSVFVKRHNLSRLLHEGINDLSTEDQQELWERAAAVCPMAGVDWAGETSTARLRASMVATVEEEEGEDVEDDIERDLAVSPIPSSRTPADPVVAVSSEQWSEAMSLQMSTATAAATDGRASVDSAATPAPGGGSSLPVGWTTTMWCVAQPAAQATRVSQCCLCAGAGRCTTGTASQVRRAPRRRSWTPPHRPAAPTGGSGPSRA